MNSANIKSILITLILGLFLSACAGKKVELDRGVFESQKIKWVQLAQLASPLSSEVASSAATTGAIAGGLVGVLIGGAIDANTNSARRKKIEPLVENLKGYDVNKTTFAVFDKALSGVAFGQPLQIETEFDAQNQKPFLVPQIQPAVVISADYSKILVAATVSIYQNKEGKKPYKADYLSEQILDDGGEEVTKDDRYQFWLDNPEMIIEKIELGAQEIAEQMAEDFNVGLPKEE